MFDCSVTFITILEIEFALTGNAHFITLRRNYPKAIHQSNNFINICWIFFFILCAVRFFGVVVFDLTVSFALIMLGSFFGLLLCHSMGSMGQLWSIGLTEYLFVLKHIYLFKSFVYILFIIILIHYL